MGKTTAVERKAEKILAEHQLEPGHRDLKIHCRCGWDTERTQDKGGGYHKHRAHQVEMLGAAGLLMTMTQKQEERT